MKQLIYILSLIFLIIPIAFSQPEIVCFRKDCYQKSSVNLKINDILIKTKLNRDGSIDFSQVIGGEYNFKNQSIENTIIQPEFYFPPNSPISMDSLVIEDVQRHLKFEPRYRFENFFCDGFYVVNKNKNSITLCTKASRQIKIVMGGKILSNLNYSTFNQCGQMGNEVTNYVSIPYLPTDYSYDISFIAEGGEGVMMDPLSESACQDPQNSTLNALKLNVFPHPNGFRCDGKVLPIPSNKIRDFILTLSGKDEIKIKDTDEKELKNLQKQNINASIAASNAAIATSKATNWNAFFTLILAILTGVYVIIMRNILKEDRKSKKKQENDELIESIYEPIYREICSRIYLLEEDIEISYLLNQEWDYRKNNIKNLVKLDPSIRREIEQFYQNIKEYNEALTLIKGNISDLIRNILRKNQKSTDLVYKKLIGNDLKTQISFVNSVFKSKHPREILHNSKSTGEGWAIPNNAIFDEQENKIIDEIYKNILLEISKNKDFIEFTHARTKLLNSAKQLKEKFEKIITELQLDN